MSSPRPIELTITETQPDAPEYAELFSWPFATQPFYEAQVLTLLRHDVPYRVQRGRCFVYVYHDPDGNCVGFSTMDLSNEYEVITGGHPHPYIPVLAVNPRFQQRGHGKRIVNHLVGKGAVLHACAQDCSDLLFLDVYQANTPAISLYEKCEFRVLNPDEPLIDSQQNDEPYFVMARRVSVAQST